MKYLKKALSTLMVCLMLVTASLTVNTNVLFADEFEEEKISEVEPSNELLDDKEEFVEEVVDEEAVKEEEQQEIVGEEKAVKTVWKKHDSSKDVELGKLIIIGDELESNANGFSDNVNTRSDQLFKSVFNNIKINYPKPVKNNVNLNDSNDDDGGIDPVSLVFDLIGITVDVLKMFGIIPDEEQQWHEDVMSRFNSIDNSLDQINQNVTAVYNTMVEQYRRLSLDISGLTMNQAKQDITNFYDRYTAPLLGYISQFNTGIKGQAKTWYETYDVVGFKNNHFMDSDGKLVADGELLTYRGGRIATKQAIKVKLDGQNVSNILNAHRNAGNDWKANGSRITEVLKKIFTSIVTTDPTTRNTQNLRNNPSLFMWLQHAYVVGISNDQPWINMNYRQVWNAWNSLGQNEKDNLTNRFVEMVYNSIINQGIRNYASANQGTPEAFASKLITAYKNYCAHLADTLSGTASAYQRQLDLYKSTYVFEGDLNKQITYDQKNQYGEKTGNRITVNSNLAELAKNKYVYEISNIGNFVSLIAKASGMYDDEDEVALKSEIFTPWAQATINIENRYKNFHKGNDKFNYLLNRTVELQEGELSGGITMTHSNRQQGLIPYWVDTYESSSKRDFTFSIDGDILNSSDVCRIYASYLANNGRNGKASETFYQYLKRTTGYTGPDWGASFLITNFRGTQGLENTGYIMNNHTLSKFGDTDSGYDFKTNSNLWINGHDSRIQLGMRAVAETFSMNNGQVVMNSTLAAMATAYVRYAVKDDKGIMHTKNLYDSNGVQCSWEGDYRFAWGSDVGDNVYYRYNSTIDYCGHYNALVAPKNNNLNSNLNEDTTNTNVASNIGVHKYQPLEREFSDIYYGDNAVDSLFDSFDLNDEKGKKYLELFDNYSKEYDLEDLPVYYEENLPVKLFFDFAKYGDITSNIIEYILTEGNIEQMAKDYDEINKFLKENDNITPKEQIILKPDVEVIYKALADQLDCKLVDTEKDLKKIKPKYNHKVDNDILAYVIETGILYKYNGIGWHELVSDELVNKYTKKTDGKEFFFGELVGPDSTDIVIKYLIEPILIFDFFNGDKGIDYKLRYIYDIQPAISWKEKGVEQTLEINDEVLKELGVGKVNVRIPVYSTGNEELATIAHYSNYNCLETPKEEIAGVVQGTGNNKFVEFKANTFSPFEVVNLYNRAKPSPSYIVPNTSVR